MKLPSDFTVVMSLKNIGRPDGTTRDTWLGVARLMDGEHAILGSPVATGDGHGKRPEVAASRSLANAFERRRGR